MSMLFLIVTEMFTEVSSINTDAFFCLINSFEIFFIFYNLLYIRNTVYFKNDQFVHI